MKNLILALLPCIFLVGCGLDGNTAKVADYSGITMSVTTGKEQVRKAIAVADQIAKTGTKAGSLEIKGLQLNLKNSDAALQGALNEIAKSKADNAANVKKANAREGDLMTQNAGLKKVLGMLVKLVIFALFAGYLTGKFAPLIKAPLALYPPTAVIAQVPDWIFCVIVLCIEGGIVYLLYGVNSIASWIFHLLL